MQCNREGTDIMGRHWETLHTGHTARQTHIPNRTERERHTKQQRHRHTGRGTVTQREQTGQTQIIQAGQTQIHTYLCREMCTYKTDILEILVYIVFFFKNEFQICPDHRHIILVISPLLSLINDQLMRWRAAKVKCAAITGDMDKTIVEGKYSILITKRHSATYTHGRTDNNK